MIEIRNRIEEIRNSVTTKDILAAIDMDIYVAEKALKNYYIEEARNPSAPNAKVNETMHANRLTALMIERATWGQSLIERAGWEQGSLSVVCG